MQRRALLSPSRIVYALGTRLLAGPEGEERFPRARRIWQPLFDRLYSSFPFRRRVAMRDFQIYVSTLDTLVSQRLLAGQEWERRTSELFRRELRPGMVVLDIGAHIGYFTLLAARLVGERGRVFAFEPLERCCRLLTRSLRSNGFGNVTVVPKGASNQTGRIRLGQSWRMIDVVPLDEFFADPGFRVDFIKMDIDGGELAALEGMKNLVRNNPAAKVVLEYDPACLKMCGVQPAELFAKLDEMDFQAQSLCDDREDREIALPSGMRAEDATRGLAGHANLLLVRP